MKAIILMACFLAIAAPFFADGGDQGTKPLLKNYLDFSMGGVLTVFGDMLNVRDAPSTSGKVIAAVPCGTELTLLDKTEQKYKSNNYEREWLKVKFKDNSNKEITGYAWAGFMSVLRADLGGGTMVLWGVTGKPTNVSYPALLTEVRVVRNNAIISRASFIQSMEDTWEQDVDGYEAFLLIDPRKDGFKPALDIISVYLKYFCYEASFTHVLAFDGKNLYYVDSGVSGHDEGIGTSYRFIYPGDTNGRPNAILFERTDFSPLDETYSGDEEDITTILYLWDGKGIVKKDEKRESKKVHYSKDGGK